MMTIFDEVEEQGFQKGLIIAKLWLQNVPIPKIAESVGLPVERIEKLLANFKEK